MQGHLLIIYDLAGHTSVDGIRHDMCSPLFDKKPKYILESGKKRQIKGKGKLVGKIMKRQLKLRERNDRSKIRLDFLN